MSELCLSTETGEALRGNLEVRPLRIPKRLHFCFGMGRDLGGMPWSLVHYVCVKSAIEHIKPSNVYFYCEDEPKGPWWRLTREMVTLMRIRAPRAIFGNPLLHPAHRADVVRLEKLLEFGGIYLDCDVFVHRDFDDLLQHSVVLGRQGERGRGEGLCNAVICAEAEAPFLRRWHAEYKTFRSKGFDRYWDEHSVQAPLRLSREFPGEITVLPSSAFFWPTWAPEGLERIFGSGEPISAPISYANHLWETAAWERFLEDLTPRRLRKVNSNFHLWARPMVATLPDDYGAPAVMARFTKKFVRIAQRGEIHPKRMIHRLQRKMQEQLADPRASTQDRYE